jgi:SAM-dependent methyltransferase
MRVETIVTNPLHVQEAAAAKDVYVDSEDQPAFYPDPAPGYATFVADAIASMKPASVLEFGCNAGRNLDQLRRRLPDARLLGVDINPMHVAKGRSHFGLDLRVADEAWLGEQPDDAFDVALTVSVIDHMPYPEATLRELLRVTRHHLVLFELAYDRLGKATHNLLIDGETARLRPAYRYSYIHDYRQECERKLGARCVLDVQYPIGADNLLDLYRLYVFTKQPDARTRPLVQSLSFAPITA